jgi:hypothetical protein
MILSLNYSWICRTDPDLLSISNKSFYFISGCKPTLGDTGVPVLNEDLLILQGDINNSLMLITVLDLVSFSGESVVRDP